MGKEFNCKHPKKLHGEACAGCLAELYELLARARHYMREAYPDSPWLIDVKKYLDRKESLR